MPRGVPYKNRSPYGWWIASYLQRLEYAGEDRRNLTRRCLAWENTILLKARNRQEAWRKAIRLGKRGLPSEVREVGSDRKGFWLFEGLTSLLPVYESLEDGAELMWAEHSGRSVKSVRALVKAKHELAVFDDVRSRRRR
jgi:hypothetical protein